MTGWLPYLCSAVVAFGLIYARFYYFEYPGRELLRTRRYAAQLRDRLEYVAVALDVKTSTQRRTRNCHQLYLQRRKLCFAVGGRWRV